MQSAKSSKWEMPQDRGRWQGKKKKNKDKSLKINEDLYQPNDCVNLTWILI